MTQSDPDRPGSRVPDRDRPVLSEGLRSEFEERLLEERVRSRDHLGAGAAEGSSDRIAAIEEALVRLREHPERYGACETCGVSLDLTRLQVFPWARHCGEHVGFEATTYVERER